MGQRLIDSKKGAAMVEMVLALPILLIVLFAILELGFILYNKAVLTNASREGARVGIIYQPSVSSNINGAVNTYLDEGRRLIPPATLADFTINVDPNACPGTSADPLTVRVTYTYDFFLLSKLVTSITGPIVLVGETIMRCDYE